MNFEKSCGAVVFSLIDEEIRYLLVANLKGNFGFPKGHMEKNETEVQTALREVLEETGLRINLIDGFRISDKYLLQSKENTIKEVIYFLATFKDQKIVLQKEEISAYAFLNYEQALLLLPFEHSRKVLTTANDYLKCLYDDKTRQQYLSHS